MKKILLFLVLVSSMSFGQIRLQNVTTAHENIEITIKNHGTSPVDISNYWISMSLNNFKLGDLIAEMNNGQSTVLNPNQFIYISKNFGTINGNSDTDFSLYANDSFTDANSMLDFIQVGSTGNGRESIAIAKGIWSAGDFLDRIDTFPNMAQGNSYTYEGASQGMAQGKAFWSNVSLLSTPEESWNTAQIYPNPAINHFSIQLPSNNAFKNIMVFDMTGKRVIKTTLTNNIDISGLKKGLYMVQINAKNKQVTKKLIIK